jgi:hypothetical protein
MGPGSTREGPHPRALHATGKPLMNTITKMGMVAAKVVGGSIGVRSMMDGEEAGGRFSLVEQRSLRAH